VEYLDLIHFSFQIEEAILPLVAAVEQQSHSYIQGTRLEQREVSNLTTNIKHQERDFSCDF
jgi:hypothetical protein